MRLLDRKMGDRKMVLMNGMFLSPIFLSFPELFVASAATVDERHRNPLPLQDLMNPETTIAELLRLWPRLPGLAGAQWPSFYWQLVDLLRAFRRAASDEQRAGVAIRVRGCWPRCRRSGRLGRRKPRGMERGEAMLTRGGAFAAPVARDEVWAAVDELLQPEPVTRWTDVLAPGRVQTGQRFAVVVGLTCQAGAGEEAKPISVLPGQTVRVVVAATELEVIGERAKELRVLADRDSEPVVFYLCAPGSGQLRPDARFLGG